MNQIISSPVGHSRGSGNNGVEFPSNHSSPSTIGPKHRKRKSDLAGLESSDSEDERGIHGEKKHRVGTGVKRACNECRQQKVKYAIRYLLFANTSS